jgi:hypothetical protein
MDEGDGPVVFPPFRTTVHFLDLPAISHHKSSRQNNGMSSRHYFATQQVPIPIQGWCVECSRSKKAPWDFRRNFGQHPLDFVNSAGPSPTCLHSTPTIVHRTPTLHPYRYSIQSIRSNPPQPSFILRLLPLTTLRPRCLFPFFLSPSAFQLISVLTVSWENRI